LRVTGMGCGIFRIGLTVAICVGTPSSAFAQQKVVGDAAAVVRYVEGVTGPDVRKIKVSDNIFFDDQIITREDSASKIHFPDDTYLTVGPNSRVTIDAFVYDPDSQNSKMVVNATLGVARFVTGRMGSAAYQIRTPTTTIGVRGTVLTVTVAQDGTTSAIVEDGSIEAQGQVGDPVVVEEGLSTTVKPGKQASDPAPPDADVESDVANMDIMLLLDGGDQGGNDAVSDDELAAIVEEVEQTRAAGCGC